METTTRRESRLMTAIRQPVETEGTLGARGKILLPSAKVETAARTMRCRVDLAALDPQNTKDDVAVPADCLDIVHGTDGRILPNADRRE